LQKSPVAREVARSFADAHTKNCKFRDMFPRTWFKKLRLDSQAVSSRIRASRARAV